MKVRKALSAFALLAIGFVSQSSFADGVKFDFDMVAVVPRTGAYTCGRLNPASLKYDCLSAIQNRYIDTYAAGACDRYTQSYATLTCMQTIAGHKFKTSAVDACDRFNDANETNICLWAITDCFANDAAVRECDAYTGTQDTISCFRYYCGH